MTTDNMQMYVVVPVKFTQAQLLSTTASDVEAAYNPAATYATGVKVKLDSTGRLYSSLQDGNTGNAPATSPLWWADIGPTNRLAMFDNMLSTQTTATSALTVELSPGQLVTNLAVMRLEGSSVKLSCFSGAAKVYEKTIQLEVTPINSWYDYYFKPKETSTVAIFDNLPLYLNLTHKIEVVGPGTVACGNCVYGLRQDLGDLSYDASAQVIDYSKKTTDEFGVTEFVKRDYADEFSGQLEVYNAQVGGVKRILRSIVSTPTLFVGTSDERFSELFVSFGWLRNHRVAVKYDDYSILDIEIGALV